MKNLFSRVWSALTSPPELECEHAWDVGYEHIKGPSHVEVSSCQKKDCHFLRVDVLGPERETRRVIIIDTIVR